MRLLKSIILTAAMVVLGSVSVFAGETEFAVDEIGVKFQVPDGVLGYTRTSDISKDIMNALGYTTDDYKEYLVSKMKEDDIYFVGFDANVNYQISLKSVESTVATYSTLSDEQVLQLIDEGLDGEINQYGVVVSEKSVFAEQDRKYAVVGLTDATGHQCYLYAIADKGRVYYFYIRSYQGDINDSHKTMIKQIAGSGRFYEPVEAEDDGVVLDTLEKDKSGKAGAGFISIVIEIAKIVAVLVIAVVLLIIAISGLSKKKVKPSGSSRGRGRGKNKQVQANYGRRDFAYQERLRRVMGVDDLNAKPQIQEAKLEAADDGVKLEDTDY